MICPEYFVAKVGDVETYFTHTINFRERVPPIVELFYGCVPIVIEVGLIAFASLWSLTKMKTAEVVFYLLVVKVTAVTTDRHLIVPRNFTTGFIIEALESQLRVLCTHCFNNSLWW